MNQIVKTAPCAELRAQPLSQTLIFSTLIITVCAAITLNVCTGSVPLPLAELRHIIIQPNETVASSIVWKIRLPRAIAAVLGGGFLAVSGLLLQVYFRNPIVGPFILGISSGATLMVSIVMLTTLTIQLHIMSPILTTVAAICGAYGVMIIVVAVASRVKSGVTLLIVGMMMGYLCHSVTAVLTALAEKQQIKGFILWQLGSFSGFKWSEIQLLLILGSILIILIYTLSKPLNAILLGEEYALSMGININRFRVIILLAACAMAGMVTAMAGPVAFIGLAVPHMARMIFSTSDNRILIPGALLLGGLVTTLCDFIARTIMSPVELPLSAITALFGAPIVISLLMKKRVKL